MKKVLITLGIIVVVIVVVVLAMTRYATAPDDASASVSPTVSVGK